MDIANPHTNLRVGLYLKDRGLFRKARQHLRRTLRASPHERRAIKALSEMPEIAKSPVSLPMQLAWKSDDGHPSSWAGKDLHIRGQMLNAS